MSDRVYEGYVQIAQVTDMAMLTLRADLSDKKLCTAIAKAAGLPLPDTGMCSADGPRTIAWMSPDELLITLPAQDLQKVQAALTKGLSKFHTLIADVSDARALFTLRGTAVRDVLAKLSPADTAPAALPVGSFRRTRFGQVAGAAHMADDDAVDLICFRSVADYMFDLLCDAAKPGSQCRIS